MFALFTAVKALRLALIALRTAASLMILAAGCLRWYELRQATPAY